MSPVPENCCPECQNPIIEQLISLVYERDQISLQIRDVPALVCSHCGKKLISGEVATAISNILDRLEADPCFKHIKEDIKRLQISMTSVKLANLELVYS